MDAATDIIYWDRRAGREQRERVLGGAMVRWLYGSALGRSAADGPLSRAWFSRLVGFYQRLPLSRLSIGSFVRNYAIPLEEFEPGPYRSFDEFFVRRFRPGARDFNCDPDVMPAFAEARYLAYEALSEDETFPVKGTDLSPRSILLRPEHVALFHNGPVLVARLCPVDYHWFHYPADGRTLVRYCIPGRFHSVNPAALRRRGDVFAINARQVSVLETDHFGRLAYVEVGAMAVGKIVQTHADDRPFARGDTKGCFRFGASTVILFGEAGRWVPEVDLLEQTAANRETLVRLGEPVARMRNKS
jgi:phosphatidylserine decarboxylase